MKYSKRLTFLLPCLLILGVVLVVCFPLFRPGFFVSDDGGWMIIRLSAFYQSLREGQFPVRFLGRLNFSYGYPVPTFLYPGFLYIGSFIHLLGFPFISSVKIILAGSIALGAVFTFLWLRKYFRTFPSLVGAVSFVFAPYLLFDIYTRGSVGEVLAIAWASMGLYSIAAKKPWLLAISTSLLIISHNSLAFLFLGLYAIYITVLGKWREYSLMLVVGIGMVMFFWFPALYERKYVVFDAIQVANPASYFITGKNLWLVGLSSFIAVLLSLFTPGAFKREKKMFLVLFFGIVFMVFPVSAFLWQSSLLTHLIQFPYRFLSIAIFLSSWFIAYILEKQKNRLHIYFALLFIGLGLWTFFTVSANIRYTDEPDGYYSTNEATTTVQDEYMPRWITEKPKQRADEKTIFYKGRGTFEVKLINSQTIDTVVHALEESVVQVNTIYYPGWGATLDETPIKIQYTNPQGVIRIPVPQGNHHLVVSFRETISRFLADNISLVFFIWFVILCVLQHRKQVVQKR